MTFFLAALLTFGSCVAVFAAENEDSGTHPDITETKEQTASSDEILMGDADSDGQINVNDATLIQQYAAEFIPVEQLNTQAADINRNGVVEISDCTIIQRYIAEFISDFDEWKPLKELTLNEYSLTLRVGEQFVLTTSYDNDDTALTFCSENSTVVKVDDQGTILAVGEGVTTVIVTAENGLTAQCNVTIEKPLVLLTLETDTVTLGTGEQFFLQSSVENNNGVHFVSDNPSVASVSENGTISAEAIGTALITATDADGQTAQCVVTVKRGVSSVSLNAAKLTLGIGETFRLCATIGSGEYSSGGVFSSNVPTVASVTDDGMITAMSVGQTEVFFQANNGTKASCIVTVKNAPKQLSLNQSSLLLKTGDNYNLVCRFANGEASNSCVYTSSDSTIAEVNAADGTVTANEEGFVTITCSTYNGVTATCTITVCAPPNTVTASPTMLTMGVGECYTLHAVYDGDRIGYKATFASDNTSVASVDAATGEIVAKTIGYATITVKSFNGKTAKCYLTVKKAPTSVAFCNTHVKMIVGESVQFYLRPKKTDEGLYSATYTCDNQDVLYVTSTGKVKALQKGTATVTATSYNGIQAHVQVTVLSNAGSTTKTITIAVALRTDASWKSSNIIILSKGTKVTTFDTSADGRWIKAEYGQNYGWIYNKALGVQNNYTEVSLSTLPAVADDFIFDQNVSTKNIFQYILHNMSYRHVNESSSLEEMAVYILKYQRGSCYQRAALTCYLYERIGLDSIYVSGSIPRYGSTEHRWALVKTNNGWRHVDPTPVILQEYYMKTDVEFSELCQWDKNLYPTAE